MKRILYNENDEIEISLRYFAGDFYELIWRFKECKKFLWFKIHDKWKCLNRYESFGVNGYRDPRDDLNWRTVKFDLGRESDVQRYESIKGKVPNNTVPSSFSQRQRLLSPACGYCFSRLPQWMKRMVPSG